MAKRRQPGVRAQRAGRAKGSGGELNVSSFLNATSRCIWGRQKGLSGRPNDSAGSTAPAYTLSGCVCFWGCEAPCFSHAPVLGSGSLITHHQLITGDALGSGGFLGARWAVGFSSTRILRPVPAYPHSACLFSPTHKKKTRKRKVHATRRAHPVGPWTLRPDG